MARCKSNGGSSYSVVTVKLHSGNRANRLASRIRKCEIRKPRDELGVRCWSGRFLRRAPYIIHGGVHEAGLEAIRLDSSVKEPANGYSPTMAESPLRAAFNERRPLQRLRRGSGLLGKLAQVGRLSPRVPPAKKADGRNDHE